MPASSASSGTSAATEFDVSLVDQYACHFTAPVSVAVTGGQTDTHLTFNEGGRLRLELSSRGGLFLIVITAPSATEFATFEPLAEQLLTTLDFAP